MAFDKKIELAEGVRQVLFDKTNLLVKHESYDELFPKQSWENWHSRQHSIFVNLKD
jgi:hypothetical protein